MKCDKGDSLEGKRVDKSTIVHSVNLRYIFSQDIHGNDFQMVVSPGTEPLEYPRPYGGWADPRERRKCAPRSSWNKKDDSAEREDRRN